MREELARRCQDYAVAVAANSMSGQVKAMERIGRIIASIRGGQYLAAALRVIDQARESHEPLPFSRPIRRVDGFPTITANATFQEVVDWILGREPVLARTADEVAQAIERGEMAFARAPSLSITRHVQDLIASGIAGGLSRSDVVQQIREDTDWTNAYAENVWQTNSTVGYARGVRSIATAPELGGAVGALQFNAVGDRNTRPNHAAADGFTARPDDPAWQVLTPALGFNCFLPGTLVSGAFVGGARAWYDGDVVDIETRSGRRVSVTVNHPIATRRGWVAAKDIGYGDNLACYGLNRETLAHATGDGASPGVDVRWWTEDEDNVPSRIDDVFHSFGSHGAGAGGLASSRVLPLDFHGDARFFDGDVDVYAPNRVLQTTSYTESAKGIVNLVNPNAPSGSSFPGYGPGPLSDLLGGAYPSSGGFPGGGALPGNGLVPLGLDTLPFDPLLVGPASLLNASVSEPLVDRGAGYADFVGDLFDASAGLVFFDDVSRINVRSWSGHVYDLTSVSSDRSGNGWMVAGGIVSSNCRCRVRLLMRQEVRRMFPGGIPERQSIPIGAGPDPGFAPGGGRGGILGDA